jgi:hypothetical protein
LKYSRRDAVVILGAAAVAAALPAGAALAGTTPTIYSWGGAPNPQGLLAIVAGATTTISGILARVRAGEGGSVLAIVETFDLSTDPSENGQLWLSRNPLLLPNLGTFWIEWEVHTVDGGMATVAGRFEYWAQAVLSIAASPMTVDTDHRSVDASGRIMGRHPGTMELSPLAGFPVGLMVVYNDGIHGGYATDVSSDADGYFGAVQPFATSGQIWAWALSAPERFVRYAAQAETPIITMIVTATRLHLEADATKVVKGTPVHVRGQLEQQSAGGWVAFAGQRVAVNTSWDSTSSFFTTDTDGWFSATVTPPAPGTVNAAFNNDRWAGDPYFAEAWANLDIRVLRPVTIEDYFTVTHSRDPRKPSTWDVVGYLKDGTDPANVQIQTRYSDAVPWRTIKTVQTENLVSNTGGRQFKAELEIYGPTFVRAFVAETNYTLEAASKQIFVVGSVPRRGDAGTTPVIPPRRG